MKPLFTLSLILISTFTNAQTVCDLLDFVSVKYSPFTDTIIVVHLENYNTNEIFDYPGFVLLDENDDTLAVETVNYFGIGAESVHALNVRTGVHNPSTDFLGTLELHTDVYSELACNWQLNQSLCANTPCDSLIIEFQNWGGALVIGDFAWSVLDSAETVLESGVLTMTVSDQYWSHGLCLTPGNYSYELFALGQPSGGGPVMTVTGSSTFGSPIISQWFNWQTGNSLEFPFYTFCAQSPNTIERPTVENNLQVLRNEAGVILQSAELMKAVFMYSIDGKLIRTLSPNTDQLLLHSGYPNGVYLIRVETGSGLHTIKLSM